MNVAAMSARHQREAEAAMDMLNDVHIFRAELLSALSWAVGKIEGMGGDAGMARRTLDAYLQTEEP